MLETTARGRWGALGLLALAAASVAPGCASYRPSQSGYLSDYSRLQKDPFHLNRGLGLERVKSRNATAEAACQVDSFFIEPARWLVDPKARAGGDPARERDLTSALDAALREQLGALKPVVDRPGPRTARVRSAITTVKLARPALNVLMLATFATPVGIGPIFNGGGVVEVEAVGPDGRQIAAVSCGSAGGPLDFFGYYSRSAHARKAMRRAAKELRETLEPCPPGASGRAVTGTPGRPGA